MGRDKRWPLIALLLSPVALLLAFFAIGGLTPRYFPDPEIEGKRLSTWVQSIQPPGFETAEHTNAVKALQSHSSEALPALVRWSRRRDSPPQSLFYVTVDVIQLKFGPQLLDYFGSYCTRAHAAKALAQVAIVNTNAIGPLCDLLKDPVDYVREEAAGAFATMGRNSALAEKEITKAQSDSDFVVRERCASALEQLQQGEPL